MADLTAQQLEVLLVLDQYGTECTRLYVAAKVDTSQAGAGQTLSSLVRRGLVRKQKRSLPRRRVAMYYQITRAGHEARMGAQYLERQRRPMEV